MRVLVLGTHIFPGEVGQGSLQGEDIAQVLPYSRRQHSFQAWAQTAHVHLAAEHDVEGEQVKQQLWAERYAVHYVVHSLSGHVPKCLVVEQQPELDVGGACFRVIIVGHHKDIYSRLVKNLAYLSDLALHVVQEAFASGSVTKKARLSFHE